MRVLVRGDSTDSVTIRRAMGPINIIPLPTLVYLGAGTTDIDRISFDIANEWGWSTRCETVDWRRFGRRAVFETERTLTIRRSIDLCVVVVRRRVPDVVRYARGAGITVVVVREREVDNGRSDRDGPTLF